MVGIAGEPENRSYMGIILVVPFGLFNQLPIPGHSDISLAVNLIGQDLMSYRK